MSHPFFKTFVKRAAASLALGSVLTGCSNGLGIQKLDEMAAELDSGGLEVGNTGAGSGNNGSGSSGSGSGGTGSDGSGSSGSGSGGSGSSGSGSGGSGSSGSGGSTDADGDGYVASEDCDDSDRAVNPAATELCDGIDNDCDGLVDAADSSLADGRTGYLDNDNDGYGDSANTATVCSDRSGYSYTAGDCDDNRYAVNPGAMEVCDDGLDNDCSGAEDDSAACARNLTGGFIWLVGFGQLYPGGYNCGLLWNLTGTENTSICPSCDFAFDINAAYDASASFSDGLCTGMSNFRTTWAYDRNYYGTTPYFLEYYDGAWIPITSNVRYSAASGTWTWNAGLLDYAYGSRMYTYYYTYYQYMVAYIY